MRWADRALIIWLYRRGPRILDAIFFRLAEIVRDQVRIPLVEHLQFELFGKATIAAIISKLSQGPNEFSTLCIHSRSGASRPLTGCVAACCSQPVSGLICINRNFQFSEHYRLSAHSTCSTWRCSELTDTEWTCRNRKARLTNTGTFRSKVAHAASPVGGCSFMHKVAHWPIRTRRRTFPSSGWGSGRAGVCDGARPFLSGSFVALLRSVRKAV